MTQGSLQGKTALITGGARRLGRAVALELADHGANVVVHYRQSEREARALVDDIAARGVRAWALSADFDDPGAATGLVRQAIARAGSLDLLINNASFFPTDELATLTFDALVRSLRVNAWAPFALSRAMHEEVGRGHIVNLLDAKIYGEGYEDHVSYLLGKEALARLTRMAARAFAPGFTVNAVAPGAILPPPGRDQRYLDELGAALPLERAGTPMDIARAVIFLLESDFITGHTLIVDGGQHLRASSHG
jgi:NAD(P)-dependent dehydrogenase (short-subunit alcohol dehydrogenase family)